MSNLLFMDESNGNGVYAAKPNNAGITSNTTTTYTVDNNVNSIINATSTISTAAATGNLPTSVSNEDLSQSLSEYTDADESISAPTEFLAEFLSAVMLKDYKKALKYCKLILQYEPNNVTAKEFYPLILDKLQATASSDSDENYNKSSSPELQLSYPDEEKQKVSRMDDGTDEFSASDNSVGEPNSNYSNLSSSNCDSPEQSFSESMNEEPDEHVFDVVRMNDDNADAEDDDEDDDEEEDINSSSGDDLPIDEQNVTDDGGGNDVGHASNSSSGAEGRSRSDNTTHSYSSLLLEEEEVDLVPVNLQLNKNLSVQELDVCNGNKIPTPSCSDSESPTEPLTQRLAAILRRSTGGVCESK